MPYKFIGTIIIFAMIALFCGFNTNNRCDINLIFHTFKDIPVFMSIIIAFCSGCLIMTPFIIFKKTKSPEKIREVQPPFETPQTITSTKKEPEKKSFFKRKDKKDSLKEKNDNNSPAD